jgi:sterol desaturase/sphingolipid hydroxylase (fatty acid hydroxylase superfamily)
MHKVHHHHQLPLTDSNYGNIFAIWDRIFGTFVEVSNPKELVYGIDTYHTAAESDHLNPLLTIPFKPLKSAKDQRPSRP